MINSVWANTADIPDFPPLYGDKKTDVLIVGGGLTGLLCTYALTQAGADCLLIEADHICSGVSRNTTAKITSQHGLIYSKLLKQFGEETALKYWEANEMALAKYRELCQEIDCDFAIKDNYVYSVDRSDKLEQELKALSQIGVQGEYTKEIPLPLSVAGAIRFKNQAQFHPLKFASAIAKDLPICEKTTAREFADGVVTTDRGRIYAKQIIIATHFPIINKHGGYFLKMYQDRSYVLALENAQNVDGMYVDETAGGLSFRNYNGLLLLGGGGHRTGKQGGGWAELEDFTKKHYPQAGEVCRWATQDCMTLDAVPYIGRYGKRASELYVATGFQKWGMTSAMVSAMVLCDMVQGRDNPYASVFSPSRTILRPQLLKNVLESTANLLSCKKPRCPHLGCALQWNGQEHSWDCPCHGSRFAQNGKLLNEPATGDLRVDR